MPSTTIKVDFTGVEAAESGGGYPPIPDGDYEATIFEIDPRRGQGPEGKPYLNVQYRLSEPPYENRRVFGIWSLAPKALSRFKRNMLDLGIPSEELTGEFTMDWSKLIGMSVIATLSTREYAPQGSTTVKKQNNVDAVRLPGTPAPDRSSVDTTSSAHNSSVVAGPRNRF